MKAKKGGGGKFAWGKSTDMDTGEAIDRNDPNYSSEEDEKVAFHPVRTVQLEAYKDAILAILEEYFTSGDLGEVVVALRVSLLDPRIRFKPLSTSKALEVIFQSHQTHAIGPRQNEHKECQMKYEVFMQYWVPLRVSV